MSVPAELLAFLRAHDSFSIAAHIDPDGDALGSCLALSLALESAGKKTFLYCRDAVPEMYRFLPGNGRFGTTKPDGSAPLILVDCNEPERAGLGKELLFPATAVIDHHETEKDFGDVRWVERDAAATGLLICELIPALGTTITRDMATNLYTAIAIDTGTFRYRSTTSQVLRIAADLIDAGADPAAISEAIYETWSDGRFRLFVRVLNTLEIVGGIALTHVSEAMFRETGTHPEDTEHFSNVPRTIAGIRVSAFFREIEGGWKVSLRSKGRTDVAGVALLFKGGGHRNAAGFRVSGDLPAARSLVLAAIQKMCPPS